MQGWPTQGSPIWCPFLKLHSYATVTDFVISSGNSNPGPRAARMENTPFPVWAIS